MGRYDGEDYDESYYDKRNLAALSSTIEKLRNVIGSAEAALAQDDPPAAARLLAATHPGRTPEEADRG